MDANKSAENTTNALKFISPNCLFKPKMKKGLIECPKSVWLHRGKYIFAFALESYQMKIFRNNSSIFSWVSKVKRKNQRMTCEIVGEQKKCNFSKSV